MNRGGAETLIMNLYRNIDRNKVQFDFLTCKEGVFDTEIRKMGGMIHRIPYVSDVGHFKYIRELNSFFSKHPYQIVHSHMDKMSGLVLRAAKKVKVPIRISHSHSTKSEGNIIAKCYKWYIGNYILQNATHFFACSSQAAKWLFSRNSARALYVKNAIESKKFIFSSDIRNEVRRKMEISDRQLVIGHVGRFSIPKNHLFLIEIFKEVIKIYPESILILVGDGPLQSNIKYKVQEYDLEDKVKFLGSRDDVNQLLQAFDLFMFPSLYEGLPVTVIEAQASGLPCLISDRITEEVDIGSNLVNFITLSSKKLWVENLSVYQQPVLNRDQSVKALIQKNYDIQDTSKQLEIFYSEVLG